MEKKTTKVTLLVSLALGLSQTVLAAKAVNLNQQPFDYIQQHFKLSQTSQGVKSAIKSTAQSDDLIIRSSHKDFNNTAHIRLQQHFAGVPVWGATAVLHVKNDANRDTPTLLAKSPKIKDTDHSRMNGMVYENLSEDLANAPSKIFQASWADKALQKAKQDYLEATITKSSSRLIVYVDKAQKAHWAYKVSFLASKDKTMPEHPVMIFNAENLDQVFVKYNNIKTAKKPALTIGFGGNEHIGEYMYGRDFPALNITRNPKKQVCFMENKDVKVVDLKGDYLGPNKPMRFSCTDNDKQGSFYWNGKKHDGYDKVNGAYSPSNDALYVGYVVKHMYQDWYGIPVLTQANGKPMQLIMRVHFRYGYANAFWDDGQMTFGDGDDGNLHPLVSLGIGAHEISHGFTEQHSDLIYEGQSGGLNESFSDMASQAAEYYSYGKSSWLIGENVVKDSLGIPAFRFMDQPSLDGRSIDSAKDYYEGMDVHYSSGVFNRLFYLLATSPGWDTKQAFSVMVKANQDYWTASSDFSQAACGLLYATRDFAYDTTAVDAAIHAVDIDTSSCSS